MLCTILNNPKNSEFQNSSRLVTYLLSHKTTKTNKTSLTLLKKLEKYISDVLIWTRQCRPTSEDLYQQRADSWCIQVSLPGAIDSWETGNSLLLAQFYYIYIYEFKHMYIYLNTHTHTYIYIYIYIYIYTHTHIHTTGFVQYSDCFFFRIFKWRWSSLLRSFLTSWSSR